MFNQIKYLNAEKKNNKNKTKRNRKNIYSFKSEEKEGETECRSERTNEKLKSKKIFC